jgi:anti-sigma regulatory factor (Ser/Thr protein kinase)
MQLTDILSLFEELSADKIGFVYHGIIKNEFTHKIIELFEKNVETDKDTVSVKNKIVYLVGETFQNIVRHSDTGLAADKELNNSGVFILRYIGNFFYITSANLIHNSKVELLKSKLAIINELDKEQLKELHMILMSTTGFSEKGGAGLGLIQMARKSDKKLEFDFEKLNEDFSFFYFQIKINSNISTEDALPDLPISSSKELHSFMELTNSYLAYKGNFSQKSVLILLKIVERNIQINSVEDQSVKSVIFSVLTELLQNISKHAYKRKNKREGIFLIGKSFDDYIISTGNYITNADSVTIVKTIEQLNNMSKEQMQKLYLEKLRNSHIDNEGNAGLGFIEIARECKEKIKYIISPVNDIYSFFTISIKI